MKKNLKKIISAILMITMLFSVVNVAVSANSLLTIDRFEMELVSGEERLDSNRVYTVLSNEALQSHKFVYRLNYTVSGEGELDPGAFVITVPTALFTDREGQNATNIDVAVPYLGEVSESDTETKFVYNEVDGEIRIYNRIPITTAESGNIEFSVAASKSAKSYIDMTEIPDITATLNIAKSDYIFTESASKPGFKLNTGVKAGSVSKDSPNFYSRWQASWGLPRPADADDYYYLSWPVTTRLSEVNQYYDFTLTDIFDEPDADVIGYKFQNTTAFSANDTVSFQDSAMRYDYVLTRHKISTYGDLDIYSLHNDITATVTPFDRVDPATSVTSNNDFVHSTPVYEIPVGRFWSNKSGESKDDRLREFISGEIDSIGGLEYETYIRSYSNSYTVAPGSDISDPASIGQVPLTYENYDNELFISNAKNPTYSDNLPFLDYNDYDFSSVTISADLNGAYFDAAAMEYITDPTAVYSDTVEVFAFVGALDRYVKVADYNPSSKSFANINSTYVTSAAGSKLNFAEGVDGCGTKAVSPAYSVDVTMTPSVTLFRTENVLSKLYENASINYLCNVSRSKVTSNREGDTVTHCTFVRTGSDEIRRVYKDSSFKHYVNSAMNNKLHGRYEVSWTAEMVELEKFSNDEIHDFVLQNGGIFYVLLPNGASVDKSTVTVSGNDGPIGSGSYSVSTVLNYKDSGRTLLKVNIRKPGRNYRISYTTYNAWESVKDYGLLLESRAAYETRNDEIYNGSPDNGGGFEYMDDLDSETEDEKFLYGATSFSLVTLMATNTGLELKVQSEDDDHPTTATFVHQNQSYFYRIRIANDNRTLCKDLIAYNSIENYITGSGGSDWRGALTSVDVSNVIQKGCTPVIYLSAFENLSIPDNLSLDAVIGGERVWIPAEDFGDIAGAKAVAVDCTRASDGGDFVLGTGESFEINLYMKAPPELESESGEDASAYNGVYMRESVILGDGTTQSGVLHQAYTTVNYRAVGDIKLKKVSSADNSRTVDGVTFTLSGDSVYGTHYDMSVTSDSNGEITFPDIEQGEYIITETETTADYLIDRNSIAAVVNADGSTVVEGKTLSDGRYIVENTPRVHGDLEFIKVEKHGNISSRLSGAQFMLYGKSDYGNDVSMTAVSGTNGIVRFNDIEKGRYTLAETYYPSGMIDKGERYTVVCDSNGFLEIQGLELNSQGDYEIANEPYCELTVFKADAYNQRQALSGAEFRLTRADSGPAYDKTVVTNGNGTARFDRLETGNYILEEISAPENYFRDEKKYNVTIDEDHNITIDGLIKNEIGFVFPNDRQLNGEIKITKLWQDGKTDDERPVPKVHISRKAPEGELPIATLDKQIFTKTANNWGTAQLVGFEETGEELTLEQAAAKEGAVKVDDNYTPKSIYAWPEAVSPTQSKVVWWSDASVVYLPEDSDRLFYKWSAVEQLDLNGWNTSKIRSLNETFYDCRMLTSLRGVRDWDVSGVKYYKGTFENCYALTTLDGIKYWDVCNALNMSRMFAACTGITSLESLSLWDVSSVMHMENTFLNCTSLASVSGLRDWNTGSLKDLAGAFNGCSALISLEGLENWETGRVTTLDSTFRGCSKLTNTDELSGWDTGAVKKLSFTFYNCTSLTSVDGLSDWNTGSVLTMASAFYNCNKLASLGGLSDWNTGKCRNLSQTFYGCSSLTSTSDISAWDTSRVTTLDQTFRGCSGLLSIDLGGWDTSRVTTLNFTFYNCSNATSLTGLDNWNTGMVTNMSCTFYNCAALINADELTNWDTSSLENLNQTFQNCTNLTSLHLNNWDTSSVKTLGHTFRSCTNLQTLEVSNWDISNVTTLFYTFGYCNSLRELDVSNWNTINVTNMSCTFYQLSAIETLDLDNWNTDNVTTISFAFTSCSRLTSINIGSWNTSKITDFSQLFSGCESLRNLDINDWDVSNVTNFSYAFRHCSSLTSLELSKWNVRNGKDFVGIFSSCTELTLIDLSGWNMSSATSTTSIKEFFNRDAKLVTIIAGDDFNSNNVESNSVFTGCVKLVGGNGTVYDSNYAGSEFARVDTNEHAGYFTEPAPAANSDAFPTIDRPQFDAALKELSDGDVTSITSFTRDSEKTLAEVQALSALRVDDNGNGESVYLWSDGSGAINWWCSAAEVYLPKICFNLFGGCTALTSVDTTGWNMSRVKNLCKAFYNCSSLTSIDVSGWDTSELIILDNTFFGCSSLASFDASGWDTGKVENMNSLFRGCSSLSSLDLSGWNTENVNNMAYTFAECSSLSSLDISDWDTGNVVILEGTFSSDPALTSLDVSNWDTGSANTFYRMFYNDTNLASLDLGGWDMSNAISVSAMFQNGYVLTSVGNIGAWDVSKVRNMSYLFTNCKAIKTLNLNSWNTSNVATLSRTFNYCTSLESINISDWNTHKVTDLSALFMGSTKLSELNIGNWDTGNVTNLNSFVFNCSGLLSLDLNNWDTGNVTTLADGIHNCTKLRTLNVSNWDTSCMTNIYCGFNGSYVLTTIDVSNWDVSNVTNMGGVFGYCQNLTSLDLSKWDTSNVTNLGSSFNYLRSLNSLDLSTWDTSKVTSIISIFSQSSGLTDLNVSNWDLSSVTNMNSSFYTCTGLEELDLSGWNTAKVTTFTQFLRGCIKLKTVYASESFTMNDTAFNSSTDMFNGCTALVGGNGTAYSSMSTPSSNIYANIDSDRRPGYFTLKSASEDTVSDEEYTSEDENWIINGDGSWTYLFNVFDDSALYYFTEDEMDGYSSDGYAASMRTINKGRITKELTVTNTAEDYTEPDPEPEDFGSVSVSKTVIGDGLARDETDSYILGDFTFTITLTVPEGGYDSWIEGSKIFGRHVFLDGVATFTLHDNQTVEFTDIPAGLNYTVAEAEKPGFTPAYTGETGTVVKDGTAEVGVINTYSDETEKNSFTIEKKAVNGNSEDEFGFSVLLSGLTPEFTYFLSDSSSFVSDKNGGALVSLVMKPGDSLSFIDLPVGAEYKVSEDASDYIASYEITDAQNLRRIRMSANGNSEKQLALSTATETVDAGEEIKITFTNTKPDDPVPVETTELNIIKNWVGDTPADRPESIFIYLYQNTNILRTFTLTADDNWRTVLTDLPAKDEFGKAYSYSVSETQAAGYYAPVYESSENTVTITNTKVVSGSVEVIHSLSSGSTGRADCLAKVEVLDSKGSVKYTYAQTDEPIIVEPEYIFDGSEYTLRITLTTVTDIYSGFAGFEENVKGTLAALTEAGIPGVSAGSVVFDSPEPGKNTAVLEIPASSLISGRTQHYTRLPFFSNIEGSGLKYSLTFRYNSNIGSSTNYGAQSYKAESEFSFDELDKYVVWNDDLVTADGHKGWYMLNSDTMATFLAEKCPYEKNLRENMVWDYTDTSSYSVSYSYNNNTVSVVMNASQTPITTKRAQFKLPCYSRNTPDGTVFYTEDPEGRAVQTDGGSYKITVNENGEDVVYSKYLNVNADYGTPYLLNEEENIFVSAPDKIYSEDFSTFKYFQYWSIQTVPADGESRQYEIARCYYIDFNFSIFNDCIIEAVYGETQMTRQHLTSASITFTENGRNQWNLEKGKASRDEDDRIFSEFVVSFDRADMKQLNTYSATDGAPIKTGVLFDRIATIEEANLGTADEGTWKTQSEVFYAGKYGASGGVEEAEAYILSNFSGTVPEGHQYTNSDIPIKSLDKKNRVVYVKSFANVNSQLQPTDRKNYVYRAYAYMLEPDGTTVTVSNPVYFTIYDIATITNAGSQSNRN